MLLFTVNGFALITALRQQLTAVVCTGYCIFRDSNVQLTKIFTSAVWRRVRLCLWFRGEWACREYGERKNRKWRRRTIGNETQKGERGRQRKRDREARFTFVVSTHRGWWLHFFFVFTCFLSIIFRSFSCINHINEPAFSLPKMGPLWLANNSNCALFFLLSFIRFYFFVVTHRQATDVRSYNGEGGGSPAERMRERSGESAKELWQFITSKK